LEQKGKKRENERETSALRMAVQDVAKLNDLKDLVSEQMRADLQDNRDKRVDECHYVLSTDKSEIRLYKYKVMRHYLNNQIDTVVSDNFATQYTTSFLKEIGDFLDTLLNDKSEGKGEPAKQVLPEVEVAVNLYWDFK